MLAASRGLVDGHSVVFVVGHRASFDAADGQTDINESGVLVYLTAAETMEIASTSASDASAGIGMRTVLVAGVDGTGAAAQETVTLNGTTDVTTVNSYLRVNSIVGLTVGTSESNVGAITATATTAATVQCEMGALESISQNSAYTVPLGHTLYVYQIEMNAAKISGGGNPEVEFFGTARFGGDGFPWIQMFDKVVDTSVSNELTVNFSIPPGNATERSDIRFRALTNTSNTEARIRMYGMLIKDGAGTIVADG